MMSQRAPPSTMMQPMFPDGDLNVVRLETLLAVVAEVVVVVAVLGRVVALAVLAAGVTVTVLVLLDPQPARASATRAASDPVLTTPSLTGTTGAMARARRTRRRTTRG